ncbi:hypothetical protein PBAL39_16144 [Pedobacter sp. BAL39]|nr:hypothetical protein PBAL39_16144 [Pedobacter sp. BAL39]
MRFIKNALLGIALYEGFKYWLKNSGGNRAEKGNITLGGKQFAKTESHPLAQASHRHHLDRPESMPE